MKMSVEIDNHVIEYDTQFAEELSEFKSALESNALRIIDGYPVPVVVVNSVNTGMPQYATERLAIDGTKLRPGVATVDGTKLQPGIASVDIEAFVSQCLDGKPTKWRVEAVYVDKGISNYTPTRSLLSREYESTPDTDLVDAALGEAIALLNTFDLTSEHALRAERTTEFKALLLGFPESPTRAEYEEKCRERELLPVSDRQLVCFANNYDFRVGNFAAASVIEQLEVTLKRRRGCVVSSEQAEIDHEQLDTPADERELLACGACLNTGYAGESPFSTAAFSGMCDDCL